MKTNRLNTNAQPPPKGGLDQIKNLPQTMDNVQYKTGIMYQPLPQTCAESNGNLNEIASLNRDIYIKLLHTALLLPSICM
jgi:hypothetical protein